MRQQNFNLLNSNTMNYLVKTKELNGEQRILCYLPEIGKSRIYRQGVDSIAKGLKPFKYKRFSAAKSLAADCNRLENTTVWEVFQEVDQPIAS